MDSADRTYDEWLALRCQTGEREAFEDLILAMERPLRYYATKFTGSDERAIDVLQEVWLLVFRKIGQLKEPAALRPWLYRLTRGVAVDHLRHTVTRRRAEDDFASQFDEAAEPDFDKADAEAVHQALDALDPVCREVLVLQFMEDFGISQIAEVIGCPVGTVKSRIHYAKKQLKEILERGGYGTKK